MRIFKVMFVWGLFSFFLTAIITVPIGFRLLNPERPFAATCIGALVSLLLADIFHRIYNYYTFAMLKYTRM